MRAGTHEFQGVVNLWADTTADIASGSVLIFNNALYLSGNTLTKTGVGTISIRNDFAISDGMLNITEGTVARNGTVGRIIDNRGGAIASGNSPGVLSITSNLNNGANGTVAIEIESTAGAGQRQGQIQVSGSSMLDGTLAITNGGSYSDPTTRSTRDNFTLITSVGGSTGNLATATYRGTALTCDFTDANGSFRDHINNGLFRNINYEENDVTATNLFALGGDADGDIDIDITDFNILASNFDDAGANFETDNWTIADFDITDFKFLAANFADTSYGGAVGDQVPEPKSLVLLMLGGLLMFWARVKRGGMTEF